MMKPATIFFVALTIVIPLFTTPSLSSDYTPVLDAEGNPLELGESYYIAPPKWGSGGSVTLGGENVTCKADVDVVQNPFGNVPSTPFTISPVNLDTVTSGSPVAIQSPTENDASCKESTVWKVSIRREYGVNIITTGGIINTPSSCFRITKPREHWFQNSYIFEYCPYLCGAGFRICQPVGIYTTRDNKRHLSPNRASSFEFLFIKASAPDSAAII